MSLSGIGPVFYEYEHSEGEVAGPEWDPADARYHHPPAAENGYRRWTVVDIIHRHGSPAVLIESDERRATVSEEELRAAIGDRENPAFVQAMYAGNDDRQDESWIPHPRQAQPEAVSVGDRTAVRMRNAPVTPTELTFEKIEGQGSKTAVNQFLEGADDNLVCHKLGGVNSWKAAFVARYEGAVVSCIVLYYYNPEQNGEAISITRLANHESAPHNTSSWMISKARKWAERVGYERIVAYAGVGGNGGTCYGAAGFEAVDEPETTRGTDWSGESQSSGETWERQKYVYHLTPEVYEDKDASWAVETVADGVLVPGRDGMAVLQCQQRAV
jgi:hypothetical protein